jgi:hypothetical protein
MEDSYNYYTETQTGNAVTSSTWEAVPSPTVRPSSRHLMKVQASSSPLI